jgi:UDP-glucose 4-epimerase
LKTSALCCEEAKMKILVTGGLGFVGLHLARLCAEKGAEVIVADILEPTDQIRAFLAPVLGRVRLRPLDVRQRDPFEALVRDEAIGHIVHAAAMTPDYGTEQSQMDRVLEVNLVGAINAILAAARAPLVEQFILLSSSGLYGAPQGGPPALQHETDALDLGNLYTITKYSAELLLQRCRELCGKRMAAVRLASIYGEMERPTGSREHMSHIQQLHDARLAGRRVRVAGPAVERDWMYAGDMAEGIWALLGASRWNHPVYNLGSGQALPFDNIVALFARFGLQHTWVDDPQQADIAMQPHQARAPLDTSRLQTDTRLDLPGSPANRLEHYLSKVVGATD